ncbi:MAG: hypothetical protein JWN04_265 [Myxococcaceae bacterium]|nr:hypothetical protein [Myxococcaceae bacterium]
MPLVTYDATTSMRAARSRYFEANAFGDNGGYDAAWVNFKLGPLPLSIPNTASRARAVPFHDLHHVITGYDTDMVGEFEISAWEVGAGCRDYWAAWFINLGGVAGGLFAAPRRTFRAFVRGRHSVTLYGQELDALLDSQLGELRAQCRLSPASADEPVEAPRLGDVLRFALAVAAGLLSGLAMLVLGTLATPFLLCLRALQQDSAKTS